MALINIHDEEEMFGLREVEAIASPRNSGSEAEDDYDDDVPEGEGEAQLQQQPNEDNEAPDASAAKVIKPKRVVKNPQPKFDAARLCGPRGIGVVQKFLSDAPYRGKGYETEDLGLLLQKLKHWAHRLYPKLPFLDSIAQIEKLGNKKAVQVNVKRLRLDMYDTPTEDAAQGVVEEEDDVMRLGDAAADADEPDVFDELLKQSGAQLPLQERLAMSAPVPQPVVLSAEQKERIERNRRLALERQRAKIAAASRSTSDVDSSVDSTPQNSGETASSAGRPPPDTVPSRKRNLDESGESEDENIQPTQEEVRRLREKLIDSVISQPVTSTNSTTNNKGLEAELDDDYDAIDVDAAVNALKDVENHDDEATASDKDAAVGKEDTIETSSSNSIIVENLNSTTLDTVESQASILKPNDDPASLCHSQFDSNLNDSSESSLMVDDQTGDLSIISNKVATDVPSSAENQSCNNLTSSIPEMETSCPTSNNTEASCSSQLPESKSIADASQGSIKRGARNAECHEGVENCSTPATAEDQSVDPNASEADAAIPSLKLPDKPDKIDNFSSEDCDVSR